MLYDFEHPVYYMDTSELKLSGDKYILPGPSTINGGTLLFNGATIGLIQTNSCPHCTFFKPTFQSLANNFRRAATFITFQLEDVDEEIIKRFIGRNTLSVPFIFSYVNGVLTPYEGSRDYNIMESWVKYVVSSARQH